MPNLLHLWVAFNTYAKANPLVAGAVSLWGLGIVTWLCKGVPMRLWGHIKRQCTTTLTFTSDSTGAGMETFLNFMRWFEATRWAGWSRSLSILGGSAGGRNAAAPSLSGVGRRAPDDEEDDPGTVVGVGEGRHFFVYAGRPFWLEFSRVEKGGSTFNLIYQIRLTALGRSRARLLQLIEEFRYRPKPNMLGVFGWSGGGWSRLGDVLLRPLGSVVVKQAIKDELVANLRQWSQSRDWYEQRGLPYKLTCVLKGRPGTGKTSLIKALASHFRMNLCVLNLASMSDQSFERALADTPTKSIIVIEDFDSSAATQSRKGMKPKEEREADAPDDPWQGGLTLSGILNALDGVISLDGKIIFLTTNVYEAIDPALLRKGRVDFTYELAPLGDAEVREYVRVMFPEAEIPQVVRFADILGCDLQGLYFDHRNSAEDFIAAIPKVSRAAVPQAA